MYDEANKTVRIPLAALTDGQRRTKMVMFTCNKCGETPEHTDSIKCTALLCDVLSSLSSCGSTKWSCYLQQTSMKDTDRLKVAMVYSSSHHSFNHIGLFQL